MDRGFEYQHNVKELSLGIVIVHVTRNKVVFYRELASDLLAAVTKVRAGEVLHVGKR